jgi:hypothetical protein
MPQRIRDARLCSALTRSILSSPDIEFPLLVGYLLEATCVGLGGDSWEVRMPDVTPAIMSRRDINGVLCGKVLRAEPADVKAFAADLLGLDVEHDPTEYAEWSVTPNENYNGCMDVELGISQ